LYLTSAGEDYQSIQATLEWHYDSELTQCILVPVINDECLEEKQETFEVSLSSEEDCIQLTNNSTLVTIQDDDSEFLYNI